VTVVLEEPFELGLGLGGAGARAQPDHEETIEAVGRGVLERDSKPKPVLDGAVEVEEPAQLVGGLQGTVDACQPALLGGIGAHHHALRQRRAELVENQHAVAVAEQDEALGQERRSGRAAPRRSGRRRSRRQVQEGDLNVDVRAGQRRSRRLVRVCRVVLGDELVRAGSPDCAHEVGVGLRDGVRVVVSSPHSLEVGAEGSGVRGWIRNDDEDDVLGRGLDRPVRLGIERRVVGRDVVSAARADTRHERSPRGALAGLDAAGAPDVGPVALDYVVLVGREVGLEGVNEAIVREDPHQQFAAEPAGLEAQREQ
jgi:hypothetical protein